MLQVVNDSLFPMWQEEFHVLACHNATCLRYPYLKGLCSESQQLNPSNFSNRVTVLDSDLMMSQKIGYVDIDCSGKSRF
jgi:hypothetical protein